MIIVVEVVDQLAALQAIVVTDRRPHARGSAVFLEDRAHLAAVSRVEDDRPVPTADPSDPRRDSFVPAAPQTLGTPRSASRTLSAGYS
jgi:hypothetical protein